MLSFDVGIRKYVENNKVLYWLLITAKVIEFYEEDQKSMRVKFKKQSFLDLYLKLVNAFYWKIFIIFTIFLNTSLFITYFWLIKCSYLTFVIVIMHLACLIYWIDFIGRLIQKRIEFKKGNKDLIKIPFVILDSLSLIPLSIVYLIVTEKIDYALLWQLRTVTLLRFYWIPWFFSTLSNAERNHWKILITTYACFLMLFVVLFANDFLYTIDEYSPIDINDWDKTFESRIIVSLYYSIEIVFNVAYGDIFPVTHLQRMVNSAAMIMGTASVQGIFPGVMATAFYNKGIRREYYRQEYEDTVNLFKERKIDKKVMEKIKENMLMIWQYKEGFMGEPPVHILPLSLQKEIYFDINYGLLNRSLIFSEQPRSFLRSVSLFMKNISYLPGDIILEQYGTSDRMLCVASGVIEVLSEENDESVLFSLTTGTIIGEATLFLSIPTRCIIRAATYVELQVLMKVNFYRLALTYPEIFRSMRSEIYDRLKLKSSEDLFQKNLDSDFKEIFRRKETGKILKNLRESDRATDSTLKTAILGMYVLSENIPRVKTLPLNLIRARPWILRPHTSLAIFWNVFISIVVILVVILYPLWTAFYRNITPIMYTILLMTKIIFVIDLYLECTTAIERKDHFTYITSVKEIIAHKLKTPGFYLDVLATYYLSVYADLIWPKSQDFGHLLLSLNGLLKTWRLILYIHKLESNIKNNLLLIVTIKYITAFTILVIWVAVLLYLEACFGETCYVDRWLGQLETRVIVNKHPAACLDSPVALSIYFASLTFFMIGYGDLYPTALADCLVLTFCMVLGGVTMILCIAEASSAFKHLSRIRVSYQEEIFAVDRFMTEHEIPKNLQKKVRNYLQLQWDYDKGFSLTRSKMKEFQPLQKRLITRELTNAFLTVPLFQNADVNFVKMLAKLSKVRVLPPNEDIVLAGSFAREMYILEKGYCQVETTEEGTSYKKIIGPMNSFGYVDMILGNVQTISVHTLTHARVISLQYFSYLKAVTKYPSNSISINEILEKKFQEGGRKEFNRMNFKKPTNKEHERIFAQTAKIQSKTLINVYKYHQAIGENYWEPFHAWGKYKFLQYLILPFAVSPKSSFMKIWIILKIIKAVIIAFLAPVQFCFPKHQYEIMIFLSTLKLFSLTDLYLMFHLGFYNKRGLLIFHPAKTAIRYLKGNFITDLITTIPYSMLIELAYAKGNNNFKILYEIPALIMITQLYKFFQIFRTFEENILQKTDKIKIIKLIPLALFISNFFSGVLILLECYNYNNTESKPDQEYTRLAKEYAYSVEKLCLGQIHKNYTVDDGTAFRIYLITVYWVTSTMIGCGFGDISAHDVKTMLYIALMIILGIFFYAYVFANITSSMINTTVLITQHRRRIIKMTNFMKKKNVNPEIQKRLILHYEYNWRRTEGATPQKIFTNVYWTLREKLVASMYEETLSRVPAFKDLEKVIIRIIGASLDEIYFLRGETIVKHKDIQEYIYLIYRGEVTLYTGNGTIITTMGSGGMFGNISNKNFSLSSVIAVAAENVDILRIERKIFFQGLQVSKTASSLIAYFTSTTQDYIEPKKEANESTSSSSIKLNIFQINTNPTKSRKSRSIYFTDKKTFYFNRSICRPYGKFINTFVILPESTLHNVLAAWLLMMAYWSVVLTMYMFAFQVYSTPILVASYTFDFLFAVKIFLQFHISYFDKIGNCVISTTTIKTRYVKSREIIFDILSNLPLDYIAVANLQTWDHPIVSILRLNRMLRYYYAFEVYKLKLKTLMVNKIYLQIGWICIVYTLMIHCFGCIWFVAVCPFGYCQEPTWVTEMGLLGREKWELYFYSIYHMIIISTTAGLAEIKIYSTPEVVLDIIFMLTSRICVVLLAGLLGAAINAQSLNLYLFQDRIGELKSIFSRQNISEYQLVKMWNYVTNLWLSESGKQMPKFISKAPYAMKCEVMSEMFGTHLSQNYIFSQTNPAFLRQLSIHIKRFMFFKGNYIVQQGDIDETMYFIHEGELSV